MKNYYLNQAIYTVLYKYDLIEHSGHHDLRISEDIVDNTGKQLNRQIQNNGWDNTL